MILLKFPFTWQELFEQRMLSLALVTILKQTFQITQHREDKKLSETKQMKDRVLKNK